MNLILPGDSTPDKAEVWLRQLIWEFGLGFHLDTPPEEYRLPDGESSFTLDQCTELKRSLELVFQILGPEQPYEIGADVLSCLLAEAVDLKPPLQYHDPAFQQQLLRTGTREELIAWLCWNDPNGIYTNESSITEGLSQLTLETARDMLRDQITRR